MPVDMFRREEHTTSVSTDDVLGVLVRSAPIPSFTSLAILRNCRALTASRFNPKGGLSSKNPSLEYGNLISLSRASCRCWYPRAIAWMTTEILQVDFGPSIKSEILLLVDWSSLWYWGSTGCCNDNHHQYITWITVFFAQKARSDIWSRFIFCLVASPAFTKKRHVLNSSILWTWKY